MKRLGRFVVAVVLAASLAGVSACQPTVEVQTGTRVVDARGRVISEDIHTIRVPPETAGAYRIDTVTQEGVAAPQPASTPTATASPGTAGAAGDAASPAGSAGASDSTPPPPVPAGDPKSLTGWMPDTLEGFTAEKPTVGPQSASREYRPKSGSPAKSLVIVALRFRDAADARRMLGARMEQDYPIGASTSTVRSRSIYFGTDGQTAVASFASGAVMIVLEAWPNSGQLSAMKSVLQRALEQLP